MFRRHISSLIERALLGLVAMMVAGGAWAAIDLDTDSGGVTFARETLSTQVDKKAWLLRGHH